jgi:hypothetical protein
MTPNSLQALNHSLEHWQAIYIICLIVAGLSTGGIIAFNFISKGKPMALRWSSYVCIAASVIALVATIMIMGKTRSIDAEKDRQVKLFETQGKVQIELFKTIAAQANEKAQDAELQAEAASLEAEQTSRENSLLRIDVVKAEAEARKLSAELAVQTGQFAPEPAQQKKNKARQAAAPPIPDDPKISAIAELLKPFAGQTIALRMMMDVRSQSLGAQLRRVFESAGIRVANYMIIGSGGTANYQGVLVVVRNPPPSPHPPLADALFRAVASAGMQPHDTFDPAIPEQGVGLYIGPD